MRRNELAELAQSLKPFIVKWFPETDASGNGGGSGALTAHSLSGPYHTGTLAESQAPWAVTNAAFSAHTSNPNAHHSRQHDILSSSDHTVAGGAQLDVVGLSAPGTLALLTPSSNPGAVSALLKSSAAGNLTLPTMTATTRMATPLLTTASGGLTLQPVNGIVIVGGSSQLSPALSVRSTAGNSIEFGHTNPAGYGSTLGAHPASGHPFLAFNASNGTATNTFRTMGKVGRILQADLLGGLRIGRAPNSNADDQTIVIDALVAASGNVLVGTTTDSGYKLDVNGTLRAATSLTTPLITTASGDLTIDPVGVVKFPQSQTLQSINFNDSTTPYAGWQIIEKAGVPGKSVLTIAEIQADELAVKVFVADETRVDRGDQLWAKSFGILAAEFTTPAISATAVITFEDSPALVGALGSNHDWIMLQLVDRSVGLTIALAWGQISGYVNNGDGTQDWTFTMRSGPVGKTFAKGRIGINWGGTGQAFIRLSTVSANAPYLALNRWAGANPYTPANQTTLVRLGNLNGGVGTLGTLPSYVDVPSGNGLFIRTGSNNKFFIADDNGVRLLNIDLRMYNSSTQTVDLASTDGSLKLGTNVASPTTTGFTFDGATGNVTIGNASYASTVTVYGQINVTGGNAAKVDFTNITATLDNLNDGTTFRRTTVNEKTGAGRAYSALNSSNVLVTSVIPTSAITPTGTGLYLGSNYMGFYDNLVWKTYIDNSGNLKLAGSSSSNYIQWAAASNKLQGVGGGIEQWYADATDGKLKAGAGAIELSVDGITVIGANVLRLKQDAATLKGTLYSTNPLDSLLVNSTGIGLKTSGVATIESISLRANTNGTRASELTIEGSTSSGTNRMRALIYSGNALTSSQMTLGEDVFSLAIGDTSTVDFSINTAGTVSARQINPQGDLGYSLGTALLRWNVIYANQIIAGSISGTTMNGQEWEYSGSMVVDANSASATTVSIVNQGAGVASLSVEGNITLGGTVDGVDVSSFKSSYDSHISAYNSHVSNVNAHHNQSHVLATTSGLGSDHSVSGLTTGFVLRATGATTAQFMALTSGDITTALTYTPVPPTRQVLAGPGLANGGNLGADVTIGHADTSSQASVDNSGVSFIQDIALDTYGHVTAIGTASISAALDATYVNVSGDTMAGALSLPSSWSNDAHAITRGYALSRGMNLVTNGSGLLGNNYNFSGFTFDPVETHGGGGSFRYTGAYSVRTSDELIPVDPEKYYRIVLWAKAGNADGSGYDAANLQGAGIVCHDADRLQISPQYFMRYPGSALTTLAADLNPGATTVALTSASGWANAGSQAYQRQILWWPYVNSLGYSYPSYTYSRNTTFNNAYYQANGAWSTSGISGNTITLTQPWPGPNLPAGTPMMNGSSGSTYKYTALNFGSTVPNTWTRYEGHIGTYDTAGANTSHNLFPYGTAYVKLVLLNNITGTLTSNVIRWSDIWLSEVSSRNLESASATVPGIVTLVNQQLGAGTKWVPGRFGVNMSSAPTLYDLDVNGTGRFSGAVDANSGITVTGSASASVSVIAPLFTATSGNLTVSAPSTLLLNAAGANTVDLQINGVSQWSVNAERLNPRGSVLVDIGDYNRRVRVLHAAELNVETLVAQSVMATIGGRILVAPTTKLIANLASGATTIDVEHNNLTMGTYIYMSSVPGGVPQIEAMQVVSSATTITGGYRYTVSRNLDGTGANSWLAGDAVVSLGSAVGQGYIDLTSTSTIHNQYGPTITIFARHSTATWNGTKPVVTLGNLRSLVDYAADEYGSAAGNDLTLTPASGFAGYTIDRTNGLRLFNTDLRLYSGATEAVRLNNSVGLRLTTGAAAINTVSWHNATEGYEQATIVGNLVSGTSTLSLQARARDTVSGAFSGAAQVILSNALTASSIKLLANDGSVDGPNKYLLIGGGGAVISGVNLGVGTDDPQEKVDIRASSGLSLSVNPDYGGSTYLYTYDRVNGVNSPMILRASQFLFDTGNVGVGTAPSYKLDVNGAAHASSFPTSSDARFKEALAPVTNVLARLEHINAYNFYWRQNYAGYDQFLDAAGRPLLQIGFVAQEVEQEFPELISRWSHTGRDGTVTADAYSVDYARMVPVLVQAIRELRAELAALRILLN